MKALAVAGLLILAACGDAAPTSDPTAVPGELVLSLRARPDAPAVGAVRFKVSGGSIAQVTAAEQGITVFSSPDGDDLSVVVIGASLNGALVRIRVPDVRKASRYRTRVLELVDTGNGKLDVSGEFWVVVDGERSPNSLSLDR